MSPAKTEEVAHELELATRSATSADELMTLICERLHERLLKYNWVGFYLLTEDKRGDPELELGPFVGSMTPHTRIQLNQGICGAAASSGKTVVVDDVKKDPRYLACSIETKSEIVVPVFVHGKVVGELDIDSHFSAAFGLEDRKLVEHCAALVGQWMEKKRQ
jgi:L-methionine (R)-S-oxide reductase